jgi:hypothetical protein
MPIRAWAWIYERKFISSWKIGMKWLMHMKPHDGPSHGYLKHFAREGFVLTHHGVWEQVALKKIQK